MIGHYTTQRLTPPDVGAALASSAMDIPTNSIKMLATAHLNIFADLALNSFGNWKTYTPDHSWTTTIRK